MKTSELSRPAGRSWTWCWFVTSVDTIRWPVTVPETMIIIAGLRRWSLWQDGDFSVQSVRKDISIKEEEVLPGGRKTLGMILTAELAVCTPQLASICCHLSSSFFESSDFYWKPDIFNWVKSPLMTLQTLLVAPAQNQDQCLCSSHQLIVLVFEYLKALPAVPATPPPLLRNRTNSSQPSWLSILHSETNEDQPSWLSIFYKSISTILVFPLPTLK